jgi:hypothetical protein
LAWPGRDGYDFTDKLRNLGTREGTPRTLDLSTDRGGRLDTPKRSTPKIETTSGRNPKVEEGDCGASGKVVCAVLPDLITGGMLYVALWPEVSARWS